MTLITSRQLAWELAEHLRRRLSDTERMAVFVDLGSGDNAAAIHRLIDIAAKYEHPLTARMFRQLHGWAHAHNVQDRYATALATIESACVTAIRHRRVTTPTAWVKPNLKAVPRTPVRPQRRSSRSKP